MKYLKDKVKRFYRNYLLFLEQDLEIALQRKAANDTCNYICDNMLHCATYSSRTEIYDYTCESLNDENGGLILEFGVFKAESINYIAKRLPGSFLHGFDSFEGLPEFWRAGFDKSAFSLNGGLPPVEKNIRLYKGWFDSTIPTFLSTNTLGKISLLHVDCDLYSSTKTIFDLLGHLIGSGTIIIFDEYFNYPGWQNHEYKAFKEFIENKKLKYEYLAYNVKHEQVVVRIL